MQKLYFFFLYTIKSDLTTWYECVISAAVDDANDGDVDLSAAFSSDFL